MKEFAEVWVPLISAIISLVSVSIAFFTLYYARQDREEMQNAANLDALRRQQTDLLSAFQGEKDSVGFMAAQLAGNPELVDESNRTRLILALCLAFVYKSSSRTRALVLAALKKLSSSSSLQEEIERILNNLEEDFDAYESSVSKNELGKYMERIQGLRENVRKEKVTDVSRFS